jgi:arylsulfatase A-like enzyme
MLYRQLRQSGFHLRPDEPYLRTIRACYRAAARVTDRLAGAVLRAFLSDPSRPAVVVVLSDHGENLGEHGLFEHHSSLHETLLRVPLVAWGRGVDLAAGPSSEPVSLVSIASWVEDVADGDVRPIGGDRPVLAEYESSRLHLQVPREFRALAARSGPQALPALVLHPGLAVRVGTTKYVATGDGGEQLFDLSTDPGEEHDLLADSPGLAEPFRPAREGWLARIGGASGGAPEPVAMGEPAEGEIAAHLRRLGYID